MAPNNITLTKLDKQKWILLQNGHMDEHENKYTSLQLSPSHRKGWNEDNSTSGQI